MKKWYAPCRLLLVATMATQLVGCASTSRTVSRWMGRTPSEQQLAEADAKSLPDSQKAADKKLAEKSDKSEKSTKASSAELAKQDSVNKKPAASVKAAVEGEKLADGREGTPKARVSAKDAVMASRQAPAKKADEVAKADPSKTIAAKPVAGKAGDVKAGDAKAADTRIADAKTGAGKVAAQPEAPSAKVALEESDNPFADFPVEAVASSPTAPARNTLADALGLTPAPNRQETAAISEVQTADLSTDPVLEELMAKSAPKNQAPAMPVENQSPFADPVDSPQATLAQAHDTSGIPEWALEEIPSNKSSSSIPQIRQTAATTFQPGLPAPSEKLTLRAEAPHSDKPVTAAVAPPKPTTVTESSQVPASLSALCPDAQGEVQELVQALDSKDVETLKRTIHRLGRLQTQAVAAQPALQALMKHPNGYVRTHAALALVRMQKVDGDVTRTLIVGLRSQDAAVRSFAAAVLVEMGPESANAMPALTAGLSDQDAYVRLHVAEVLIRNEDWSHAALSAINNSLSNSDENVRWLATYSLAELAPQSQDTVDILTKSLQDPVGKVQVGAAYALGEIGPMAKSALPELERCRESSHAELKTAAEYALSQIKAH